MSDLYGTNYNTAAASGVLLEPRVTETRRLQCRVVPLTSDRIYIQAYTNHSIIRYHKHVT